MVDSILTTILHFFGVVTPVRIEITAFDLFIVVLTPYLVQAVWVIMGLTGMRTYQKRSKKGVYRK